MSQHLHKTNIFPLIILIGILFLSGCEKKYDTIIDSTDSAPIIADVRFPLTIIITDTMSLYAGAEKKTEDLLTIGGLLTTKVTHTDGQKMIKAVGFFISNTESSIIAQGLLNDIAQPPDSKPNDSVYSSNIILQIERVVVGTFYINLWSESNNGYRSNTVILPIQIFRYNHPPVISNLIAPDTISIGSRLRLNIQVSDSDGLGDIYFVGFLSRKPDGSYANNGNPIQMYDDGRSENYSGDILANDGIYSFTTNVSDTTTISTGLYTYTFYAIDRLHAHSDSIKHEIIIRP